MDTPLHDTQPSTMDAPSSEDDIREAEPTTDATADTFSAQAGEVETSSKSVPAGATHADNDPSRPGIAAHCFSCLALAGPLVLIVLWVIQAVPMLRGQQLRAVYTLSTHIQSCYLGLEQGLAQSPASSPVYTWFVQALGHIPGLDNSMSGLAAVFSTEMSAPNLDTVLIQSAAVLAALLTVLSTWCLARATGSDRKTAFAAGLVLLTGLACMGLPDAAGADLLATAIATMTSLCLYCGWRKDSAPLWLLCGFTLLALSTLAGGLPALLISVLSSTVFLIWRGTFRRAGARDGAAAFGVMLLLLCAWGMYTGLTDSGRDILKTQLEANFIFPIQYGLEAKGSRAWAVPISLCFFWLPWSIVIIFLPWERVGSFIRRISSNRMERPGQGWLWCMLLTGIIVYAFLGTVTAAGLLPLLPPLAVLTAQGLLCLGQRRSQVFFLLLAILLALLGLIYAIIALYTLMFDNPPPILAAIQPVNLPIVPLLLPAIGSILCAFLLAKVVNRSCPEGALLACTCLILLLAAILPGTAGTATEQTPVQEIAPIQAVPVAPENWPTTDSGTGSSLPKSQANIPEDQADIPNASTDTPPATGSTSEDSASAPKTPAKPVIEPGVNASPESSSSNPPADNPPEVHPEIPSVNIPIPDNTTP